MKAKHLKEHQKKMNLESARDEWDNEIWIVDNNVYLTKQQAKAALQEFIDLEFKERYIKS